MKRFPMLCSFPRFPSGRTLHVVGMLISLIFLFSCGFGNVMMISPERDSDASDRLLNDFIGEEEMVSMVAYLRVSGPGLFYPVKGALRMKRPSFLRFEWMPMFGTPDFLLALAPETFEVWIPSQAKVYKGKPDAFHMRKIFFWPLDGESIVRVLTGSYPLLEGQVTYRFHRENHPPRVEMESSSGASQILWMCEDGQLQKLIRKDEAGNELFSVVYACPRRDGGIPTKIEATFPREALTLSVEYSDVKIEKADMSLFELKIPDRVETVIVE